jgi:hypothetical protein
MRNQAITMSSTASAAVSPINAFWNNLCMFTPNHYISSGQARYCVAKNSDSEHDVNRENTTLALVTVSNDPKDWV